MTPKRIDANQPEIVEALRDAGVSVTITSDVGNGFVDAVAGFRGRSYCLEIKDGSKPPSARKLTPDEQKWHDEWKGHKAVVKSVEEAFAAVGLI